MSTRRTLLSWLLLSMMLGSYELHAASHALSRRAEERHCLELQAGRHGFGTTHLEQDAGVMSRCPACLSQLRTQAPGPDLPAWAPRDRAIGRVCPPSTSGPGSADVRLPVTRGPPLL